MKLVRAAAVVAGLADLGFAVLFLIKPDALYDNPEVRGLVYPRWLGVCALASAVMLFIAVSDPKRYLPMVFVNAGARALAALIAILYVFSHQIGLAVAMLASHGALAAILIGALAYELNLAQYKVSVSRTDAEGKKPGPRPGAGPAVKLAVDKKPATEKKAPAKPAPPGTGTERPGVKKGPSGGGEKE